MSAQSDDNSDFEVEADLTNPSSLINNGTIELTVKGGTPPYTYKWTDQSTSLKSNKATDLVEGIPYEVVITDSKGNSVTKSYRIDAESITEHFNGFFQPVVDNMSAVLFWDPFAAIGIYDPIIYADVKLIATPSWTAQTDEVYTLQKWLKPEGSKVQKGDKIAIVRHGSVEETATAF
ncbi:SprB repeat-containing protein, partial [Aquimarina celericrescens]|nr:SprB repeat-containing protein [Aquimarina celericrescens]